MKRALLFLAVARSALEAVIVTSLVAVLHGAASGREPLPFIPVLSLCFGTSLILVSVLRDTQTQSRSVKLAVAIVAGSIALGMVQPMRQPDGLALLTRAIGFGVVGEIFLWRTLSVARSISRWSDARTSALLAAAALSLAALVPGIDNEPLPVVALLAIAAAGSALSLARSTEELDLAGRSARGLASGRSALGAATVLGALAVLAAVFSPALRAWVSAAGDVLGPIGEAVLYLIALPFGYLAAFLVPLLRPLAQRIFGPRALPSEPQLQREQEMLAAMEQTRPFLFGAIEIAFALVALGFGLVLIERLTRERRSLLPEGASLDREHATGGSTFGETLRHLLPRRGARRRRPHDDGSAAAAARVLYWRFLALAEGSGAGWRASAETPTEHYRRIGATDPRWRPALAIVDAFELVRYGEADPPKDAIERARNALTELTSRRS